MIYTAKAAILNNTIAYTKEIARCLLCMRVGDIIIITDPGTNERLHFCAVSGGACTNCSCSTVNLRPLREYCACICCDRCGSPVHIEDFDKLLEEL